MNVQGKAVLLVTSNHLRETLVRSCLDTFGFGTIKTTHDGERALQLMRETTYDLVVSDTAVGGGMNGIELMHSVKKSGKVPFMLFTQDKHFAEVLRNEAIMPDGFVFSQKPLTAVDFRLALRKIFSAAHSPVQTTTAAAPR